MTCWSGRSLSASKQLLFIRYWEHEGNADDVESKTRGRAFDRRESFENISVTMAGAQMDPRKWNMPGWRIEQRFSPGVLIGNWSEDRHTVSVTWYRLCFSENWIGIWRSVSSIWIYQVRSSYNPPHTHTHTHTHTRGISKSSIVVPGFFYATMIWIYLYLFVYATGSRWLEIYMTFVGECAF